MLLHRALKTRARLHPNSGRWSVFLLRNDVKTSVLVKWRHSIVRALPRLDLSILHSSDSSLFTIEQYFIDFA